MEPIVLNTEIVLVLGIIALAVFLFIVEWIRVDMVAILMTVLLPILNLVTPKEAFSGFSSNAVISIIAVIIIGAGLDKTGLINRVVQPVVKLAGNSASRVVVAMGATVAFISSFMQNIGAAALFLPAIRRVSKSMHLPLSQMLMPIGFCAILGGTVTLVGSSPLILLNDLLIPYKLEPFGLFDVTPIGLALVAAGICAFIFLGRLVLPKESAESHKEPVASTSTAYEDIGEVFELQAPGDFTAFREPIAVKHLRDQYKVNVVAYAGQDRLKMMTLPPDYEIRDNSHLAVFGKVENVQRMAEDYGLTIKEALQVFKDDFSQDRFGILEAVVAPRSELIGKTLRDAHFWEQYQVNPVALYRADQVFLSGLSSMALRSGDSLVLEGSWDRFKILEEKHNFIFTTPVGEVLKPEKALAAGFWLAAALVMIIVFKLQLSVCLMTGAFGMILFRVLSIDEAYQAVDWRTVFLLAGLIPLGIATQKSGAAGWIAQTVLGLIGDVSPVGLLTAIAVLSTFFTLVISNVGATVLLVPLVVNMAMATGTDPRMAALVVGLATSNSFILPTHQVNALYMGPGRYRSVDFMKAGGLMTVIFIVVLIAMLVLFYGV
ncbi:MAG: SLC13 family permease [Desulfatitalea sp.]|nr:SLC13 family permease [Desulfatitalea sp.]